jgi:hypothetical protein
MELRPADLGAKWYLTLVRLRAGVGPGASAPAPRLGTLGRRWARGIGVSEEVAAQTFPASRGAVLGAAYGGVLGGMSWLPGVVIGMGALFNHVELGIAAGAGTAAAIGWLAFDFTPSRILGWLHNRPLTDAEVRRLRDVCAEMHGLNGKDVGGLATLVGDRLKTLFGGQAGVPSVESAGLLEDEFLALIGEVIRTEVHTPEAEAELGNTLKLLGDAVSTLPLPAGSGTEDATDLLVDAETLVARARQESDKVIAESLLRQAEAKAAQATAVQNAARLTRRTRALRDELRAQIAATRAALPSLAQVGAAAHMPSLGRVAVSVQAVAREAASVFAAREELAETLGETWVAQAQAPESAPDALRWGTGAQPQDDGRRLRIGRR